GVFADDRVLWRQDFFQDRHHPFDALGECNAFIPALIFSLKLVVEQRNRPLWDPLVAQIETAPLVKVAYRLAAMQINHIVGLAIDAGPAGAAIAARDFELHASCPQYAPRFPK